MLDVTVYLVEPMQRFFSTENYGEAGHTMLYAIWGGLLMGMGFGLIFRRRRYDGRNGYRGTPFAEKDELADAGTACAFIRRSLFVCRSIDLPFDHRRDVYGNRGVYFFQGH